MACQSINRDKYGDRLEVQHKHTIDVGPILLEATQRMKSIGVSGEVVTPKNELVEAGN